MPEPPKRRYKFTAVITGNTVEEIERELVLLTRGGFLLDSDYYKRNEWKVYGSNGFRQMEEINSDMTEERYRKELDEWWKARRFDK